MPADNLFRVLQSRYGMQGTRFRNDHPGASLRGVNADRGTLARIGREIRMPSGNIPLEEARQRGRKNMWWNQGDQSAIRARSRFSWQSGQNQRFFRSRSSRVRGLNMIHSGVVQ